MAHTRRAAGEHPQPALSLNIPPSQAKWLATLSDGSTAVEGKEPWHHLEGHRAPWARLTRHCSLQGLGITSLRLQAHGRTYHLPTASLSGKFDTVPPVSYDVYRRADFELFSGEDLDDIHLNTGPGRLYLEARAHYPGFYLALLVEESTGESWTTITPTTPAEE